MVSAARSACSIGARLCREVSAVVYCAYEYRWLLLGWLLVLVLLLALDFPLLRLLLAGRIEYRWLRRWLLLFFLLRLALDFLLIRLLLAGRIECPWLLRWLLLFLLRFALDFLLLRLLRGRIWYAQNIQRPSRQFSRRELHFTGLNKFVQLEDVRLATLFEHILCHPNLLRLT